MALSPKAREALGIACKSRLIGNEVAAVLDSAAVIAGLGTPGAALTAQLTTITPADDDGTPDYAIAAITSDTPFGFASAQEAITVLYVIQNLQVRVAELEARLEALGLITAN